MVNSMEIEIISRETIKPSSPTPQNLRIYQKSAIDLMMVQFYVPNLLFYPADSDTFNQPNIAAKSQCLRESLSETLTHFYPLAGRAKDKAIECNDAGVEFVEAHVNGFLRNLLENPEIETLQQFIPIDMMPSKGPSDTLLHVQANFFTCGSLALAVSFSHVFGDESTTATFLKCWSATAFGCFNESMLPKFVFGTTLHSSVDFSIVPPSVDIKVSPNCVTRRFVFEESKIAKLKIEAASALVSQPTRVEVISALIWKCANAARRTNLGLTARPSAMSHAVNLRKRVSPPLPENSVGNLFGSIMVYPDEEGDMDLKHLVIQTKKSLDVYSKSIVHLLRDEKEINKLFDAIAAYSKAAVRNDIDLYGFTSWCRMSFYENDFGWGKPKWCTTCSMKMNNHMVMMDTRDGKGVEAVVTLSEEDMEELESNEKFVEFASVNPSIE